MRGRYDRFLDHEKRPMEGEMLSALGARGSRLWQELRAFLKANYDYMPELLFGGKKYGWCYKYRRKQKTLCVLFPETKAFSALVVFGKAEIAQFIKNIADFNEDTQRLFQSAYQFHDGKWLYKRVLNKSDLKDVTALIRIKKNPKQK